MASDSNSQASSSTEQKPVVLVTVDPSQLVSIAGSSQLYMLVPVVLQSGSTVPFHTGAQTVYAMMQAPPQPALSTTDSGPIRQRRRVKAEPGPKICSNCRTTETTLWRRSLATGQPECNACNLYWRKNGVRPVELAGQDIHTRQKRGRLAKMEESSEGGSDETSSEWSPSLPKRVTQEEPEFDFEAYLDHS